MGINIEITVGDNAAFMELFGHTPESFAEELVTLCSAWARALGLRHRRLSGPVPLIPAQLNYGFYSNAEVDELFEQRL
ncbi:MAG: hypothetical protein ACLVJ6_10845 [Merdibacter sp.]